MSTPSFETDLLIVGAGPAGATLAAFLASYGITNGLMISAASGTADSPRAHMTNLSALDALRDLGVVDQCYKLGTQGSHTRHTRWCETLAEEEYARIYSWGNDPARAADYAAASPNPGLLDLSQELLEPILVRHATVRGFKVSFNTQLVSFRHSSATKKYTVVVKDLLLNSEYTVICQYLFGADGGRSIVARDLGLPMNIQSGGGTAWNVLIRSDIKHIMEGKEGNLHWNLRLKRDDPFMVNTRMIKPYYEWICVAMPKDPSVKSEIWSEEKWKAVWRDLVGEPDIDVEVVKVSKWNINETYAEEYSSGNAFCLGDAVHRHPPVNGLGSNTCIGDAFNLAWKIALVMKGVASPSLLHSYNAERQPVGAGVVKCSNLHLKKHTAVWKHLGMLSPGATLEQRMAGLDLLKDQTSLGREARKKFQDLCLDLHHETHALGLEIGHKYFSSAIYTIDESIPWTPPGREAQDPVLYYEPCTYPGRRLPHVQLGRNPPGKQISSHDLAGKGGFSLLTGIGGEKWKQAATNVSTEMRIPINAVSIGAGQDWEDVYWDWAAKRGVEEDGMVLVRPDLFVAYRAQECFDTLEECSEKLKGVMLSILGW